MSDVIKISNTIPKVDQNALLIDADGEMKNRSMMSVPIASLAELGSVASSLIPDLQMITNKSTSTVQGIYTIANIDAGDALKTAKSGNYWGSLRRADGSSKMAQLKQVGTLDRSSATMSIDPTMIMMAVALYSIEQRLNKIQEIQQEILAFLEKQVLVAQNSVVNTCADMKRKFTHYRMALYNYALAALLEVILSQNFREGNVRETKSDIEKLSMEYRETFENVSLHLEKMSANAIVEKVLKGLGTAGQTVGKLMGNVPIIEKGPVDEMLQASGEKLSEKAVELEGKAVHEFASLGNPGTSILTERLRDLAWIYNHTQSIRVDRERIYLVGEPA